MRRKNLVLVALCVLVIVSIVVQARMLPNAPFSNKKECVEHYYHKWKVCANIWKNEYKSNVRECSVLDKSGSIYKNCIADFEARRDRLIFLFCTEVYEVDKEDCATTFP